MIPVIVVTQSSQPVVPGYRVSRSILEIGRRGEEPRYFGARSPQLRWMRLRWAPTVLRETYSAAAASALLNPPATAWRSTSLAVHDGRDLGNQSITAPAEIT